MLTRVGSAPLEASEGPEDGSGAAWMRAVYAAHAGPLYQYLLRLTLGKQHLAEDLLQETLLRAWRKARTPGDDVAALRPWLFTVARRIAIDQARERHVRPIEVKVDAAEFLATDDQVDQVVNGLTVREAMVTLSVDHRTVLIEIFYCGRTAREVAERLGIPEGTVRSRAHYGLRGLRAALGAAGT
ncbi:sigma-70 family RNA polymerase sigma factor [Actinoplanes sp. NPDC051346]|uniref:sigma-70 family RNA polymerase sigma factor n=1 Tax=Actinoplanes sp. NPDC051346 TaxID=3155048 RepID=UPI00343F164C